MKEKSQEQVFTKVLDLVQKQSLYELSISQLKKETGLATGTLYYHFPSGIEDVLSGLFVKIVNELRVALFEKASSQNGLRDSFKAVISEYFSWHNKELLKSHFLYCVSATGFKNFREIMEKEYVSFSSQMYGHLEDKAKLEGLTLVDEKILDAFLLGATRELVHSWISRGRNQEEFVKLENTYIDILYNSCVTGSP